MQDRALRTRELLLHAAAVIFDEHGFAGASISKILTEAGVTSGAMYFHFKSKEDLARAVIVEQAADLTLPQRAGGLQQMIDLTFHLAVQMQRNVLFRAGVRLAVEQGASGLKDYTVYKWWATLFERELVAARRKNELLPGVEEDCFAQVLVASYTGSQLMSDIANDRADLPDRIATLWRYLLPGIATPETIATLKIDPSRNQPVV